MKYKTDLHCHTSEASGCASECGADTVKKYIDCGYTSLVITNHFSPNHKGERSHAEFVEGFFRAADIARNAANGKINIITGAELKTNENSNEYLILGELTRDIMLGIPDIFDMSLPDLHKYFNSRGCLFIQAHPMRNGIKMIEHGFVDGYEVVNSHPEWESRNAVALALADFYNSDGHVIMTAGTDHHDPHHVPKAGILTDAPIENGTELVRILKSKKHTVFNDSEIR